MSPAYLKARYGVETEAVLEPPKEPRFGELSLVSAFQLARQLRKAPRAIAAEIVAEMPPLEGVASLEIAGNGYINMRFDRGRYGAVLLGGAAVAGRAAAAAGKIIVEHTNINPNKAAHIGHLRNAVLGDTFVRMLRAAGRPRRGAELHRQHRRAGGRRRGRLPPSGEEDARGSRAA